MCTSGIAIDSFFGLEDKMDLTKHADYSHLYARISFRVGIGLALGALPMLYHMLEYACHILPPPEGDLWAALVFVVGHIGFSIVSITLSMLVVYYRVRKQSFAQERWRLGSDNRLLQQVFWQSLFYACAFYVTWSILFSVYLASVDVNGPFGLTMTVAFVAPLQGFSNGLVFIRPQVLRSIKSRSGSSIF